MYCFGKRPVLRKTQKKIWRYLNEIEIINILILDIYEQILVSDPTVLSQEVNLKKAKAYQSIPFHH